MIHETTRNTPAVRTTAAMGHCASGARPEYEGGRPTCWHFLCLRVPMAGCRTEWRHGRLAGQARSRPPSQVEPMGTPQIAGLAPKGGARLWVPQRPLDTEKDCFGDPEGIRRAVSPQPCLAHPARRGLVLSSPRTACHPARRQGHCALESVQVAPDKKKPKDLGPISPSSMKAAFCSFPHGVARGGRRGTRPLFATATNMTASRRWAHSPSPPSTPTWAFTCASSRTISRPPMWPSFCGTCCSTCAATSFCSGMEGASTKARQSNKCSRTIPVCMSSRSRSMLPNSTPPNKYGTTSRGTLQTVCSRTSRTFASACTDASVVFVAPNRNCVPSSLPQTSHLCPGNTYITYAKPNNGC